MSIIKHFFGYTFIFLFVLQARAQVFIPFAFRQKLENCTATYCPTLNPVSAPLNGTTGMTQIVNTCVDDNFTAITLPFDFYINSTMFRNWFVGSNTYLTAGTGATDYSGLGATVPAFPKFLIGAGDHNHQKVYTKSGTNYYTVRSEGNSAYGTCNAINIIYEITFYRPTVNYQFVKVVFGTHGRTNGAFGVANNSTYYASNATLTQNSSYVFYSYNNGVVWFLLPNYSITGNGVNL